MTREDLALLAELSRMLQHRDPAPGEVRAAAERAGEYLAIRADWEWLELLTDTTALVRGGTRLVRFGVREIAVEVELRRTGTATVALTGLVEPAPEVAGLEVRWPAGVAAARPDEVGYVRIEDVPRGWLQLVLRRPDGRSLATRWFRP